MRDGRLYASENHQEILKVSASPPGPRCPGLRGVREHPSHRLCPCARPALVASVRSHRGGSTGWDGDTPPLRLGFPAGQEAHQSFLRRVGAPPELLQVHGETQGDAAPLLHQTAPLQSLQLPPALQIAPRAPAAPGPPRSQGKPLLPSFSFPIFSFLRSAPAGSPPLTPQASPHDFSAAPRRAVPPAGGDAPVSSSRRRSRSSLPKQLLLRKPKRWSFRRPLCSLWFPLRQVCPRSSVPPVPRGWRRLQPHRALSQRMARR